MTDHIHVMSASVSSTGSSCSSSSSSRSQIGYSDSTLPAHVELFALKEKKDQRISSDTKDRNEEEDEDDDLSVLAFTEEDMQHYSQHRPTRKCMGCYTFFLNWPGLCTAGFLILSTVSLCLYFHCPSTLFIYLTWLFCIVPFEATFLVKSVLGGSLHSMPFYQSLPAYLSSSINRNGSISLESQGYHAKRRKPSHLSIISKRLRITFAMLGALIWSWAIFESMFGPLTDWTVSKSSNADVQSAMSTSVGPTFIAVNLYNNANLFPRYGDNLIKLIDEIGGAQNAYVSIFESNSNDGTDTLLDQLSQKLDKNEIGHTIVSGNDSKESSHTLTKSSHVGIEDDGNTRIAFLANVRNEAMRPLYENTAKIKGLNHSNFEFEKVLWLNDIVFDTDEIKELLHTNGGSYDEACAFDFMPLGLYDTWVTRDIDGHRAKPLWPYFASDRDIKTLKDQKPILVDSCWNGAVAFDARWFRDSTAPLKKTNSPNEGGLRRRATENGILPLRFRNSDICLSSECLLISLDIHRALQPKRPVIVMNPKVVTAYDDKTFFLYHNIMRWHIVQPWRLVWEQFVSAYLFQSLTDMGRKPAHCFEAFQSLWTTPHPLAQKAKSNTDILKDVLTNRWQ